MKKNLYRMTVLLLFFGLSLSMSAEHKLGKAITGKIVDSSGKELKTDLAKKKFIVLYYTASW
jgi:hypothetical protein